MDKEKIKEWFLINGVKEKTISDYISCLGTVNKILKDNNIEGLEGWNIENWNYLFGNLEKIEKYKEREISGNKILSNALSNYLKFLKNQDFFIKLRNEKSLI